MVFDSVALRIQVLDVESSNVYRVCEERVEWGWSVHCRNGWAIRAKLTATENARDWKMRHWMHGCERRQDLAKSRHARSCCFSPCIPDFPVAARNAPPPLALPESASPRLPQDNAPICRQCDSTSAMSHSHKATSCQILLGILWKCGHPEIEGQRKASVGREALERYGMVWYSRV